MLIEALFPEVSQLVPSAPELVVRTKARSVLQKFYQDSKTWTAPVAVALGAGQREATLVPPAQAVAHSIKSVSLAAGGDLVETRESAMNAISRTWRVDTGQEPVRYIPSVDPSTVAFWPAPSQDTSVIASLVLYPAASATEFHDWVASRYWDALVAGVVGALQRMANKPWSDLKLAGDNDAILEAAISKARLSVSKQGASGITMARLSGFEEL